jgi:hypothetical protein
MADDGVVAGGRLTDWVSLGALAALVPRDAVHDAVATAGRQARRFAVRLTETRTAWGCWDDSWSVPTSGGITQARQRLGYKPVKELFAEVAVPVAGS